jgi:hypothetical protein
MQVDEQRGSVHCVRQQDGGTDDRVGTSSEERSGESGGFLAGQGVDEACLTRGQDDERWRSIEALEVESGEITVVQAQLCESAVPQASMAVTGEVRDLNSAEQFQCRLDVSLSRE